MRIVHKLLTRIKLPPSPLQYTTPAGLIAMGLLSHLPGAYSDAEAADWMRAIAPDLSDNDLAETPFAKVYWPHGLM